MQNYAKTINALRDVEALFKCGLCNEQATNLYNVAKCADSFCLSCAEENIGSGCPSCNKIGICKDFRPNRLLSLLFDTVKQIKIAVGLENSISLGRNVSGSIVQADLNFQKNQGNDVSHPRAVRQIKRGKMGNRRKQMLQNKSSAAIQILARSKSSGVPDKFAVPTKIRCKHQRDLKGNNALQQACLADIENVALVRKLLKQGFNPNERDNNGWTPLHEAAAQGWLRTAEVLLEYGAVVDPAGGDEFVTPLSDAISHGQLKVARLLLQYGANPSAFDILGRRPVDIAAEVCKGDEEVTLLEFARASPLKFLSPNFFVPKLDQVVLCFSSLAVKQYGPLVPKLREIVKVSLVGDVDEKITHFIVPSKFCRRTTKFFCALALGKWIVTGEWLEKSLLDGRLADELEFEASGTTKSPESHGPKLSRENKLLLKPPLLTGISIFCRELFPAFQYEFKKVLKAAGAKVVFREARCDDDILIEDRRFFFHADLTSATNRVNFLIIYDPRVDTHQTVVKTQRIRTLSMIWILDCLEAFKILPLD